MKILTVFKAMVAAQILIGLISCSRTPTSCVKPKTFKLAGIETWITGGVEKCVTSSSDSREVPTSAGSTMGSSGPGGSEPGGNTQPQPGILTAGNFDDSINFEVFKKFWNTAMQLYSGITHESYELPSIDNLSIPVRYSSAKPLSLDLSFVVDATGSMTDELEYVKAELKYISSEVKKRYPEVQQRYSLIVYRDEGDTYVTKGNNFTSDIEVFQKFLSEQVASEGGDYPEAMHVALAEAATKLSWGSDSVAHLMFLIADAPPHAKYLKETFEAIAKLKEKSVHIYTVGASGVGDIAEKIMRYSSLVTGGEYLFLSDDSGVGLPHAEPHIPCYHVRKLNELVIDLILAELKQERLEPSSDKVLRKVGKPSLGLCLQ